MLTNGSLFSPSAMSNGLLIPVLAPTSSFCTDNFSTLKSLYVVRHNQNDWAGTFKRELPKRSTRRLVSCRKRGLFCGLPQFPLAFVSLQNDRIARFLKRKRSVTVVNSHWSSQGNDIIHLSVSRWKHGLTFICCFAVIAYHRMQKFAEIFKSFVSGRRKEAAFICWFTILLCASYSCAESYIRNLLQSTYLPAVTMEIGNYLGRKLDHGTVKRVSPLSVTIEFCSLGTHSEEFSCGEFPYIKLHLRLWHTLRQLHPVFDATVERPQILIAQKEDWTWLGIPTLSDKPLERYSSNEEGIDYRTKSRRIAREQAAFKWAEERKKAARKASQRGYHFGIKETEEASVSVIESNNAHFIRRNNAAQWFPHQCFERDKKGTPLEGLKGNNSFDSKSPRTSTNLKHPIFKWENGFKENMLQCLQCCFGKSNQKKGLMYEEAQIQRRILDHSAIAAKRFFDRMDVLNEGHSERRDSSEDTNALENSGLSHIEVEKKFQEDHLQDMMNKNTANDSANDTNQCDFSSLVFTNQELPASFVTDRMKNVPKKDPCHEFASASSSAFPDEKASDVKVGSLEQQSLFEVHSSQSPPAVDASWEKLIRHEKTVKDMPMSNQANETDQARISEERVKDKSSNQFFDNAVHGGVLDTHLMKATHVEKTILNPERRENPDPIQHVKPASIKMPSRKHKKGYKKFNLKVSSVLASIKTQHLMQARFRSPDEMTSGFTGFIKNMQMAISNAFSSFALQLKEEAKRLTDHAKAVDLHTVDFKNGTLMLLAYGDEEPRVMENVAGCINFKSTYDCFHLQLSGRPKEWRTNALYSSDGELLIDAFVDNPQQNWHVNLKGKNLFAPLFERLLEIPIIWFNGIASGEVFIYMSKGDTFPNLYGQLDVKDLKFQIVDAPSCFSDLSGSLCFRGQQVFLHSARCFYGEVPLEVSGGFGINLEDGEYHLICQVPGVEVNALMRSLDAKPFLFPIAGSLKAVFNCQGPLDVPIFVGGATVLKKNHHNILSMPPSVASETVIKNKDAGAVAAVDCVPLSFMSGNFTFNTDNNVADVYGIRAILVDGGEIQGAGNAWICPEGETDDGALDFMFSGNINFDEVVHHYLPLKMKAVPVKLGNVNGDAKVYGSILRTRLDVKWSAPEAKDSFSNARGVISISDEAIVFNSSSTTFDLLTKVQIKYSIENYARKPGSVTAGFAPELQGVETDIRLRGFDIFGLTPFSIIDSPKPIHLKLSGRVKFQGCVLNSAEYEENPPRCEEVHCSNDGIRKMRSSSLSGEILLSGMKVNQLFIAPQLSGSFHVSPQSFKLETSGRPDENLLIEYIHDAARPTSFERQSNGLSKRKAHFSLQKGRLSTHASFQPGHTASLEVHHLQLDELEVASLRGLVQKAELQLNFHKRKGQGTVSIMRPRFSGLLGESLDVSARWSGDVITLEKSILEQSFSRYELQGEYVLPGARECFTSDRDRGSMLKTAMGGQLGTFISSMGRWRLRLEVPHAEVAEMLPLARLLSRSSDPAVLSRSKEMFLQGVQNIGFCAENLKKQLEASHWIKSLQSDEGYTEPMPLPGLAELKGQWNGSLQASGGGNGDTIAEFDLHGEEWEWGSYITQKVIAVGCFSNNDGLRLDKIFIQRDKATLHADGTLAEKGSNLHFAVLNFPVELVPRLLQAFKSTSMEPMTSQWTPPPPLKGILHMEGDLRGNLAKPECDVQVRLLDGAVGGIDLKRAEVVALIKSSNRFLFNANFEPIAHSGHVHVCGNLPVNPLRTESVVETDIESEDKGPSIVREWKLDKLDCNLKDGEIPLAESLKGFEWNLSDGGAFKVKAAVKDGGMMLITAVSPYVRWLQGNADISLDVGGTLAEPIFDGFVTFHRASISSPVLQTPLSNFGGTININKNQLQVNGIEGRVGRKGRLLVEGKLPLRKGEKVSDHMIEMKSESLEVRAKNVFSGRVDSQIQIGGSILEPEVSGAIKLSHGEAYLPQEKGSRAALSRLASNPRSLLSNSYNRVMTAGNSRLYNMQSPLQIDGPVKSSAMQDAVEKISNATRTKPIVCIHMRALKIQLGPELRLVYPLILNFAVTGELELSGLADPKSIKPKGTLTFENGDVNLVAAQVSLRRDHPNRAKFEPDRGLDPTLDLVLVGADWQLKIQGHASNWQDNLVITSTRSGEQDALSTNEAARVFESQLATSILEGDGQLAFEKLAAATLETIMPRIEGKGKLGHARWRLVSAPQIPNLSLDPQADPLKLISNISFGAEVEVQLGKHLQASVARQLKETEMSTHWTLQYQLSSRLRILLQSIPSGDKRLLCEYSATSQD